MGVSMEFGCYNIRLAVYETINTLQLVKKLFQDAFVGLAFSMNELILLKRLQNSKK